MAQHLNKYNVLIVLLVSVGSFSYGFAFSVFVTSIGQPGFYAYFKLDPLSSYTATILGTINGLFAAGCAIGSIVQGWLGDVLGRKKSIFLGSVVTAVCAGITAGSVNLPMMIVFRLFEGFGLGYLICQVPLYISEVAPPHKRGLLSGLTACAFATGYLVCAWVGYGAYFAKSPVVQWRMPLALAAIAPLSLSGLVWLVPESPRFLSWHDQHEKAWAIIRQLHHNPADPSDTSARVEFVQITKQVEFDRKIQAGYIAMFRKPSWRRRSWITLFLLFASQSTGILGIANYSILIYQNLGITGSRSLLMYGIYIICGTIPNILSIFFVDNWGRRTMLLWGFPTSGLCLLATALLQMKYVASGDRAGNGAALFFIFLFQWFYGFLIDPTQFTFVAEIFPTTIRAKGIGLCFFSYFVGALTYTQSGATAFRNIGWRMYMIWFACNCVSTVIIYFVIPETKGLSLEEIGPLFGDEIVIHRTDDGQGIVENVDMDDAILVAIKDEKNIPSEVEMVGNMQACESNKV